MCQWCPSSSTEVPKENWGLSRQMCETALTGGILPTIQKRQPNAEKAFQRDYAKLYSLMFDKPVFIQQLRKLDDAISANASNTTGETNWLRLSSILSHFEARCGFPKDVLLPMGILTPENFYFYIRRGYVLKDYGAGVKHGEFTHRLQWHVVMSVITEDFTTPVMKGWQHSPFELYVSLGKSQNQGLWALAIDQAGEGEDKSFRFPDKVYAFLLDSGLGNLAGFLSKRETKRRVEFVENIVAYIVANNMTEIMPKKFIEDVNPYNSHQAYKDFERWFVDQLRAQGKQPLDQVDQRLDQLDLRITPSQKASLDLKKTTLVKKQVTKIYDSIAAKPTPPYLERKTADPSTLDQPPQHRKVKYVQALQGGVYALEGTAIWDEDAADKRAQESRTKIYPSA